MPGGGLQQLEMRARKASISLCDNCAFCAPMAAPSVAESLMLCAVAICRCGLGLSGLSAGFCAGFNSVLSSGFASGFGSSLDSALGLAASVVIAGLSTT